MNKIIAGIDVGSGSIKIVIGEVSSETDKIHIKKSDYIPHNCCQTNEGVKARSFITSTALDIIPMAQYLAGGEVSLCTINFDVNDGNRKEFQSMVGKNAKYSFTNIPQNKLILSALNKDFHGNDIFVDIGLTNTRLHFFNQNKNITIPVGSYHITQDISMCLRTTKENAEELKINCENIVPDKVSKDEYIDVLLAKEQTIQKIPKTILAEIIEARVRNILSMANDEIRKQNIDDISKHRVVLTGGGALLKGINEVASDVFTLSIKDIHYNEKLVFDDLEFKPIYLPTLGLLLITD